MKFLDLIHQNMEELATLLAHEHGKTVADAKGDIQRGYEVVEFVMGVPHLMKGEFTDGAGPGIDAYSIRQPLGVTAGITPFNFPAMIPMWKFAPAIACGNAFILKPSERDPGVPMRLAELMIEAGLPAGVLNVVNGDKVAVDALLDDPDVKAIGFVGSTPIAEYIYARGAAKGKRVHAFGGAKNHMVIMPDADMDQTVDALIGAGYGSAGQRCMAISVAVPVGAGTADRLLEKLIPRVEALKIGPSTDASADYGPMITQAAVDKAKMYIESGIAEGAKLVVDGRGFKMQGYEKGFYLGSCLFDNVTEDMRIYKEEIFAPVLSVLRAKSLRRGAAPVQRPRIRQRRRDLHARRRRGAGLRVEGAGRHGRRQRADPDTFGLLFLRRLEALGLRRPEPARAGCDPLLHQVEERHGTVALRREGRRRILHADHVIGSGRSALRSGQCSAKAAVGRVRARPACLTTSAKLVQRSSASLVRGRMIPATGARDGNQRDRKPFGCSRSTRAPSVSGELSRALMASSPKRRDGTVPAFTTKIQEDRAPAMPRARAAGKLLSSTMWQPASSAISARDPSPTWSRVTSLTTPSIVAGTRAASVRSRALARRGASTAAGIVTTRVEIMRAWLSQSHPSSTALLVSGRMEAWVTQRLSCRQRLSSSSWLS